MEIVKYIKVIIPGLRTKNAKKHILAHVSRKKIAGASISVWGLSPKPPPPPPQTQPIYAFLFHISVSLLSFHFLLPLLVVMSSASPSQK